MSGRRRRPKKGRPATGRDPLISMRMPADLLSYIDRQAASYVISRSELIRIMLEETKLGMPPGLVRSRTAYHEAGHAVIARILRIPITKVSIRYRSATKSRTSSEGRVSHYRSKLRHLLPNDRDALIMMAAAGRLAEKVLIGGWEADDSDRQDIADIRKLAKCKMKAARLRRLRQMTEMLVWRHAESIRRVATHLLHKEVLNQASVDKIIRASSKRASPSDRWTYTASLKDEPVRYLD